jgi:LEA14-like dessication related protein
MKMSKSLVKLQHSVQIIKFIVLALLVGSCSEFSDVKINDIKDVEVKGFEENSFLVSVKLDVDNPSRHKIEITEINTKVFINNQYIGKLLSAEPIVFPSRSSDEYSILLRVRLNNILGTAFAMMQLKNGNKVHVRLEGELTARTFLLKKKIPINESRDIII